MVRQFALILAAIALGLSTAPTLALWIPNGHEYAALVPRGSCCSNLKSETIKPSLGLPASSHLGPPAPPLGSPARPLSPLTSTDYNSAHATSLHSDYFSASDSEPSASGSQHLPNSPTAGHTPGQPSSPQVPPALKQLTRAASYPGLRSQAFVRECDYPGGSAASSPGRVTVGGGIDEKATASCGCKRCKASRVPSYYS